MRGLQLRQPTFQWKLRGDSAPRAGGVAIGILGGGVFISEANDDPTADAEGPDEGGACGDDLPSLDGTGKVHGELPQPGDFGKYSTTNLSSYEMNWSRVWKLEFKKQRIWARILDMESVKLQNSN